MSNNQKPKIVYDGDCAGCRLWVDYTKDLAENEFDYSPQKDLKAVELHFSDGRKYRGARAVFEILSASGKKFWLWLYLHIPGFAWISEHIYRFAARRRTHLFKLFRLIFGSK